MFVNNQIILFLRKFACELLLYKLCKCERNSVLKYHLGYQNTYIDIFSYTYIVYEKGLSYTHMVYESEKLIYLYCIRKSDNVLK